MVSYPSVRLNGLRDNQSPISTTKEKDMRAPDCPSPGQTVPPASAELLTSAVNEVEAALAEPSAALRYSRAQLAARRAAAAILAAWARPVGVALVR